MCAEPRMLVIEGLHKRYGATPVLRGVDLSVSPGQILGLVGPNGAGKSTIISIVAGLAAPDAGIIRVGGIDIARRHRAALALIGLAPQDLGIYPTLSVRANLDSAAGLAGLSRGARRLRVAEVAEALSLGDLLGRKADTLSGGQKRRLHTGMAIVGEPQLLFLDEPTVGADVESRRGILDVVRALAAHGTAVVYTSHYLPEYEELGADIAVLHNGTIVERGSISEILDRWANTQIDLTFDRAVTPLTGWTQACPDRLTRVSRAKASEEPGALVAQALVALGTDAQALAGVGIHRPSLESAYLAITGQPMDGETRWARRAGSETAEGETHDSLVTA